MRARALWTALALLLCVACDGAHAQDTSGRTQCTGSKLVKATGQDGADIQRAIHSAGSDSVILLAGEYSVERTIQLVDRVTLCSQTGATLTWRSSDRPGMMLDASRATGTTIKNLVLDGRGIVLTGSGHTVENNLIRNIPAPPPHTSDKRWAEGHGILVAGRGRGLTLKGNFFNNIADTCIMGYGLDDSTISDNLMQNVHEGIHLFSPRATAIRKNSGQNFTAMAIEVQGLNFPGVLVEQNTFSVWNKRTEKGAYAMSVVAGQSAVVRQNRITGTPAMAAGLEVGGIAPQILDNQFVDVPIVITDTPNALIQGNQLMRASILKDINRAKSGTLTIRNNVLTNPPRAGIASDHWWGHDQVIISGNQISKQLSATDADFIGILATDSDKQPLVIQQNQITIRSGPGTPSHARAICIGNSGFEGNLRGTQINGNVCESDGVAIFANSNSRGGHIGVIYQNNKLRNLRDSIQGDSQGLIARGNVLVNVKADQARLQDDR